jgi:predicted transcriptional regulator YheO
MKRHCQPLTPGNKQILESYKILTRALAEYFGPGYEMVLHSLENPNSSVIEIINGHYTGRSIGSPITDLALRMLAEIEKDPHKNNITYFSQNREGAPMKSCTIAIRGEENAVIGLLCINFYTDITLSEFIAAIMPPQKILAVDRTEHFAQNLNDFYDNLVQNAIAKVDGDPNIGASNRIREIIRYLSDQHVFTLKDAVQQTAFRLGISKNTVYLHLRNIGRKK